MKLKCHGSQNEENHSQISSRNKTQLPPLYTGVKTRQLGFLSIKEESPSQTGTAKAHKFLWKVLLFNPT